MNYREVKILKKMINGSNSRQNSRVEAEEHNEGEEEDNVEPFFIEELLQSSLQEVHQPMKMKAFYSRHTIVGREPLGPATYEVLVNVQLEGMLSCLINMKAYNLLLMLSQGPLHGHLAR